MNPATIGTMVLKYGPAVYGAIKAMFGGGHKSVDWDAVQNWLNQQHAEGRISTQDLAAADLTQSRLNDSADATAAGQTQDAQTRMRQRGMDTAPIAEATLGRINQQQARARQAAGDTAATQLYDTFQGNKQFDQAKIMAMAQARMGGAVSEANAANASQAGLVNSLLGYIPRLIPNSGGASTGVGGDTAAPNGGYAPDPSTPADGPDYTASAPADPNAALPATGSAPQRMAGAVAGRKYKFNPASGSLGYGARPTYGGGAAGRMAGAMSF